MVVYQPKSCKSCRQTNFEAPNTVAEINLNVDRELVELIKTLARAAAREDHRKANSADVIPSSEVSRQ